MIVDLYNPLEQPYWAVLLLGLNFHAVFMVSEVVSSVRIIVIIFIIVKSL